MDVPLHAIGSCLNSGPALSRFKLRLRCVFAMHARSLLAGGGMPGGRGGGLLSVDIMGKVKCVSGGH